MHRLDRRAECRCAVEGARSRRTVRGVWRRPITRGRSGRRGVMGHCWSAHKISAASRLAIGNDYPLEASNACR